MRDNEFTRILDWPGYRVFRHEIDETTKTLRLWVRRKRGNRQLICSGCGRKFTDAHDYYQREVRDLPWRKYRATVIIELYRVSCPQFGVRVEKVLQLQQIAVEHRRRYGYRRISAELRRRGMLVNHKRVLRIIREDNLLAVQPRAFVVTTDSDHEFEVYLNLASRMKLTGRNQLWVADITYIRLKKEFVYLAVILDSFSRKVVGWALDRTLAARLPIAALEQAIAERHPP